MEAIKPTSDPIIQQHDLEDEMTQMGVATFQEKVKGAVEKGVEDRTVYGTALLDHKMPKVVEILRDRILHRESGKAGRKGAAYRYLKMFEGRLDAVSFIALRLVISNLSARDVKYNSLAMRIGRDPVDLAQDTASTVTKGPTLGDLLDVTYRDKWRGTKAETSSLRNGAVWPDALGYDFLLSDLGPDDVTKVCDGLAVKGNANGTINRKLAALSLMLGVGEQRGWVRKFKLPKRQEYEGRLRYYTDDEVESLLDHAEGDAPLRNLLILAVETGMRQGELLALTPRDINLRKGIIELGVTKGNKRRSVPLTDLAKDTCKRLVNGLQPHEKVFVDRLTCRNISRWMATWKHKQGLPQDDEACFHTLRHTTCSRLIQAGVPIVVAQKWMGHMNIETTMKYAHLAPDSLDVALAVLNKIGKDAA